MIVVESTNPLPPLLEEAKRTDGPRSELLQGVRSNGKLCQRLMDASLRVFEAEHLRLLVIGKEFGIS